MHLLSGEDWTRESCSLTGNLQMRLVISILVHDLGPKKCQLSCKGDARAIAMVKGLGLSVI